MTDDDKKLTGEDIAHLTLEHLKHIRTVVDRMENDMRDIKFRVTQADEVLLHHTRQFDRLHDRFSRIETRLNLTEEKQ